MTDDLPFTGPTTAPNLGAPAPRTAHRHRWDAHREDTDGLYVIVCSRCGQDLDVAASRRGRNNRKRGNALSLWVSRSLGIRHQEALGLPEDGGGADDWIVVQTKSGGGYPRGIDRLLRSLTANADQLRGVVHVETPGAGRQRRALITLDFTEFCSWYGALAGVGGSAAHLDE